MADSSITDLIHYQADEFNAMFRQGLYKKDEQFLTFAESQGYTIYGYELTGKRTKTRTEYRLWYDSGAPSYRVIKVL
jgi:hypothetical protein